MCCKHAACQFWRTGLRAGTQPLPNHAQAVQRALQSCHLALLGGAPLLHGGVGEGSVEPAAAVMRARIGTLNIPMISKYYKHKGTEKVESHRTPGADTPGEPLAKIRERTIPSEAVFWAGFFLASLLGIMIFASATVRIVCSCLVVMRHPTCRQ